MAPFGVTLRAILERRFSVLILIAALMSLVWAAPVRSAQGEAFVLELNGAIGPASAAHILDGLEQAKDENAELVIIKMDTPGGLDTSMREIIQGILAMPLPVVTYVSPSGARAASAGTYILYASHVAAMTPGTNLGAATPIQIGAAPAQPEAQSDNGEGGDGQGGEEIAAPKNASERKAVNDAAAYIRSLAEMRGRNADWAESAVREASSLSANAALAQNVVDIVAEDIAVLLKQLDGRVVSVNGTDRTLATSGLSLVEIKPDWTTKLLATITNPNVALILMMVGLYGLFFEFMNPGPLVPGTIGAISLLLALYGLAALPVDFAGVSLIVLGLALMGAEAFSPSFGILGFGGLASFMFGATIMFDTDVPEFQIDWSIIGAVGVFSAVLIIVVSRLGLKSHRLPVQTGKEELIGARGEVADWEDGIGHVFVHSERWNAAGPASLEQGASIVVEGIDGLQLSISAAESDEQKS